MIGRVADWCISDSALRWGRLTKGPFRPGGVIPRPQPVLVDARDFPLIRGVSSEEAAANARQVLAAWRRAMEGGE